MTETMTSDEVSQRVRTALHEALWLEEGEELPATLTLKGDLELLPLDFLGVKLLLAQEFGIQIPSHELFFQDESAWMTFVVSDAMTVQDIIDYVCEKVGVQAD